MTARAGYSTREVARMLDVPEHRVRSFVGAGFLEPHRGPGGAYRFDFQDLVILRTACGLTDAGIPPARVQAALAALRRQLPRGRSLAAVRIEAVGGQVVALDAAGAWEPATGQRPLPYRDFERFTGFAVAELAERAAPLSRRAVAEGERRGDWGAEDWYEVGYELEATALDEATAAYRRALALDATHADAHLNLGRLLHEEGEPAEAEEHYRQAVELRPRDATAWFNLGVALQDQGRNEEAIEAYRRALTADRAYADAHFNLAGLHSQLGDRAEALRHLMRYKRLVEGT